MNEGDLSRRHYTFSALYSFSYNDSWLFYLSVAAVINMNHFARKRRGETHAKFLFTVIVITTHHLTFLHTLLEVVVLK